MSAIPANIRKTLSEQERMQSCALCGVRHGLEWHHVFQYGKSSIQEPFSIVALCVFHHEQCTPHNLSNYDKQIRAKVELMSIEMMTAEDKQKYYKKNWEQEKRKALYDLNNTAV